MYDPKSHAASPTASRYAAWAIVVMVIGWLIAIATGLCTGAVLIGTFSDGSSSGYDTGILGFALIVGGLPCLFGVALILAARKWGKRKPLPTDHNVTG